MFPTTPLFTFVQYALAGFWMMDLAPLVFTSVGLSSREELVPCA